MSSNGRSCLRIIKLSTTLDPLGVQSFLKTLLECQMFYAPIFIFSLIILSNVKADGKDLSKVRRETT